MPYAYTAGLPSAQGQPNIWMSYVGACGHVLGQRMAHYLVNETASRLITAEVADQLEVWPHDGGPVLPLSWTCSLDADWQP